MGSIVSPKWLLARMYESDVVIVDCRFALGKPESGRTLYEESHIPGAVYLDLERDLSAPVGAHGGRHPLPAPEDLQAVFRRAGIGPDSRVVAYDDRGGAMASRLWWLLRWLGHDAAYVMDEGYSAWQAAGFPVTAETAIVVPGGFAARPQPDRLADLEAVRAASAAAAPGAWAASAGGGPGSDAASGHASVEAVRPGDWSPVDRLGVEASVVDGLDAAFGMAEPPNEAGAGAAAAPLLLDSRDPIRYAGIEEPLDAKAGHIPGAVNRFWKGVQDDHGRWKSGVALDEAFADIPKDRELIVYCGSGVTATPNVLALEAAGFTNVKLYAGSWSDWISYADNPIATGDE